MTRRAAVEPEILDAVAAGEPLPAATSHYFVDVLRRHEGDALELSDGAGRVLAGRLQRSADGWRLDAAAWLPETAQAPPVPLVLLAGLLKPKRWTLLIEKAVELGTTAIVPLLTRHVAFRPAPSQRQALVERWHRLTLEASKQCRRAAVPSLGEPAELAPTLAACSQPNRILGDLQGEPRWPTSILAPGAGTAVLIGPEGGLDPDEVALARGHGFVAVSLGAYPVRAETAAVALLAMARDRLELAAAESLAVRYAPCP